LCIVGNDAYVKCTSIANFNDGGTPIGKHYVKLYISEIQWSLQKTYALLLFLVYLSCVKATDNHQLNDIIAILVRV
jgi:hypothetical protein